MSRSRSYTREVRNKHIARKKRIVDAVYGGYWSKYDGQLSKGKVHCSCNMCGFAKYNKHEQTESDIRRIASCDEQLKQYFNSEKIGNIES